MTAGAQWCRIVYYTESVVTAGAQWIQNCILHIVAVTVKGQWFKIPSLETTSYDVVAAVAAIYRHFR